jgi:hypothetical protein
MYRYVRCTVSSTAVLIMLETEQSFSVKPAHSQNAKSISCNRILPIAFPYVVKFI